MDGPINDDNDKSFVNMIPDENESNPVAKIVHEDLLRRIDNCLDLLSEKQREVILRRFGLRGCEHKTLEQVGKDIGLTRERVRQIQVDALNHLKSLMLEKGEIEMMDCQFDLSS
jgi:RNA polymerase nonessential primary-like sigma factor